MTEPTPTAGGSCGCSDVCSLPDDAYRARLDWIRSEFLPHVRRTEALPDGRAWEFDATMRAKLDALVALERECCSGLDWKVLDAAGGAGVRLEVHGVAPGAAQSLLAPRGGGRRLAKAGGIGLIGALVVCCVLPQVGLAALGGAAFAAPLAGLDRPLPIAVVSLAMGGLAWWILLQSPQASDRKRRSKRG
jgi:hypothetical protein